MRKNAVPVRRQNGYGVDLGDHDRCNNTALRKATRRVSQLYDKLLAPSGLRVTQRSILLHIARFGKPTLGELAASLVLDHSSLGHNLKPLVRDGYVVLDVNPDDRRNRLARLTKKGNRKLRQTAVLWEAAQTRFENRFGIAKAKTLRETLYLIAAETFDEVSEPRTARPSVRRRPRSRATT